MTDIKLLKQIREETQASIVDIKKALEETKDDYKKALEWLKKHGIEKAEKKQDRKTSQGLVESYIHQNGKVGAMVILLCETDFVAKTDEFKKLAHEVAMQVVAMNPKDVAALLKQEYIRDNSLTIEKLVKSVIGKLGENITVKNISRLEI
ncbi:MAG: translation elongation factor Ts [Candidatus Levybacteria bacterium CG_4_10_14_0_8_um_filter_35_23]|nr:MAG: translation elongation factor Ts [Candidatus Levybacteria bacterium CG_4_10_14_0_8_um_filter_35_23]